jgi:hypothetical protein
LRLHASRLCLLFLALWGLRLATAQSAFQADDSPETAAAGALLGIQHPPGYPLPSLLGRLASLGLPGSPALAQNLAAGLWACLACCLLYLALVQLSADSELALLAAAGLGLMPQLGVQAASAKGGIYTLNLALSLGSLAAFWLAAKGRGLGWQALGFLLLGLGLAGHYMSLLLFAPAFYFWNRGLPKKNALWILPGISLYLYLPLRAMRHPALNWGDPETPGAFLQTLTRAQYSGGGSAHGFAGAARLAGRFFALLPSQLPWPLLILAPLGIYLAWKSRSWNLRPLLWALLFHWLAVILYNNPPERAPWVIDAFFLPDFTLLWLFAALGLWSLSLRYSRPLLFGVAALLILALAPLNFRRVNHARDFLAYDYARDLQQALPHDALLLAAGGGDAFGFWYLQGVEKRRPDLTLIDVPLLSDWYLAELRPRIPELSPSWASREAVVSGLLESSLQKPLYYTSHNPGDRGIPFGLVSLAPSPRRPVPLNSGMLKAPWLALRARFLLDRSTPKDGNRAELMEYYPSSARALGDFARRFQNPDLLAFSAKMAQNFTFKDGP